MTVADRRAVVAAIAGFAKAYERLRVVVEQLPPRDALVAATQARDALDNLRLQVTLLRACAVSDIRDDEKLSLAQLADEIGVSKAYADHLVRSAQGRPVPKPKRRT